MKITDLVLRTASPEYLNPIAFTERLGKLNNGDLEPNALLGAAMGMCGEAGEFSELVKKFLFQHKDLDRTHAIKELGDVYWYFALACLALDTTPEEVEQVVSDKLLARFKDGFTIEENLNRREGDI